MTVAATTRKAGPFNGDGAQVNFDFAFKIFATTDVVVTKTSAANVESTLVLTTNYTVSMNADQDVSPGGRVTALVAPAVGEKITLSSALPESQGTSLPTGSGWQAKVVERALDKLTALYQQILERLGRSLRIPISDSISSVEIPPAASRANRVLGFDTNGNITTSPVSVTVYGVRKSDHVATAGQTVFDPIFSYVTGVNALQVFVNGLRMRQDVDYTETSSTRVTFLYGLAANDLVQLFGGQESTGVGAFLASAVSWIRAAAGAVSRSVLDWLLDQPVSVKDFGAVGDGVTDSGPAILAALASIASGEVSLGRGTFMTSVDIVIPDNKHLVGQGQQATIIKPTVDNLKVLHVTGSFGGARRLQVNGNGKAGISGLRVTPLNEAQVITLVNQNYNRFDDIHIESCAEGVVLQCGPDVAAADSGCWYNVFTKVHARYCTRGLWLKDGPNASSASPNRNQFIACRFGEGPMNTGIQIDAGDTNVFVGCSTEGIAAGILPNATPTAVKIANVSAWAVGNNENRFYGLVCEGCTRDIDNANATTQFFGASYSQAKVLFTAKPAEFMPITKAWTPVLRGVGVAGVNTYSNQNGQSMKTGKLVVATCSLAMTAKDAAMAGVIQIINLPYAIGAGYTAVAAIGYVDNVTLAAGYTELRLSGGPGSTVLNLERSGSAVGQGAIVAADIAANTIITFSITYWTD